MIAAAFAAAVSLAGTVWCAPQDLGAPIDPPVARYVLADGQGAAILRSELARELALRLRRTPEGKEALDGLVDLRVIDRAARDAGFEPAAQQLADWLARTEKSMVANGQTLDAYVQRLGIGRDEFMRRYGRIGVMQEHLVMKGLGTSKVEDVTSELIALWRRETRERLVVVTEEAKLPADVVATVAGEPIRIDELGATLLAVAGEETRQKHIRRLVLRDLVHREATRLEVTVTDADARAEIDARRTRIEKDPRFGGIDYATWLQQTQGIGVEEFARSPMLLATVEQRKIGEKLHPDDALREELERDRAAVLRRHGEKRSIAAIVLRAVDTPNELVPRTPAQAKEQLEALRAQAQKGRPFADLARIHSEDPHSKPRGGALGEFPRECQDLPDAVLDAAFALRLGEVSAPLPIQGGMAIVRVHAIEPPPDDGELLARLRDEHSERWLAKLLESAQIVVQ